MGNQKTPGQKKLKKSHRILWHDDTLVIVTIVHDENPKSVTYFERGVVSGYDSDVESGIQAKILELGLIAGGNP